MDVGRVLHLAAECPVVAEHHVPDQDGGVTRQNVPHKHHLLLETTLAWRKCLLMEVEHLQCKKFHIIQMDFWSFI